MPWPKPQAHPATPEPTAWFFFNFRQFGLPDTDLLPTEPIYFPVVVHPPARRRLRTRQSGTKHGPGQLAHILSRFFGQPSRDLSIPCRCGGGAKFHRIGQNSPQHGTGHGTCKRRTVPPVLLGDQVQVQPKGSTCIRRGASVRSPPRL